MKSETSAKQFVTVHTVKTFPSSRKKNKKTKPTLEIDESFATVTNEQHVKSHGLAWRTLNTLFVAQ